MEMGSTSSPWAQGSCKANISRAWGQNAAPRSEAAPGEGMGSKREAEDGNPQLLPQGARGGTKRLDLLLMGNLAPK